MASRHLSLAAWLLAIVLVAAQALLAVHDTAAYSASHAAHCGICAYGSASGSAVPSQPPPFHPCVIETPTLSTYVLNLPLSKYNTPTARAPPRIASV
ncbi:MAG TPA: hypothetical protein VKB96_03350 [Gammaproteobacteria bacterium]|nr:hypothetical protein [Gammaproteobacteria bacterium]